jgi:hypothetical protein
LFLSFKIKLNQAISQSKRFLSDNAENLSVAYEKNSLGQQNWFFLE